MRFHDLRHSAATFMVEAGVHPKVVTDMLGHATTRITLDTYSHVSPGLAQRAALTIENSLGQGDNRQLTT